MKIFGRTISLKQSGKKPLNMATTIKASDKKKRATDVIVRQIKREVSFEIKDITLALTMIDNPDFPDRTRMHEIFRYILRDGHLKSQIRTAKFKVKCEPYLLYTDNDTPDLTATKNYNKTWFNKILEYILEQEFFAYSLVELDGIDPAKFMVNTVNLIERNYVSIEKQWVLTEGTILGNYLPYSDIKNEIDLLEFVSDRNDLGTLLECAYNVIWKYYARSDWSRCSEKVGIPSVVVKADTDDEKELTAMEIRAANFGSDGYLIIQKEDEVTLLEKKSDNTHLIFKDNISLCNEEISKIINGNTATTDTKAFAGSAEVQERTMDDFTMSRLQLIVNNVNDIVIPYLKLKGFAINHSFDYPRLKAERKRKISGAVANNNNTPQQETETPQQETGTPEPDEQATTKNKPANVKPNGKNIRKPNAKK